MGFAKKCRDLQLSNTFLYPIYLQLLKNTSEIRLNNKYIAVSMIPRYLKCVSRKTIILQFNYKIQE